MEDYEEEDGEELGHVEMEHIEEEDGGTEDTGKHTSLSIRKSNFQAKLAPLPSPSKSFQVLPKPLASYSKPTKHSMLMLTQMPCPSKIMHRLLGPMTSC